VANNEKLVHVDPLQRSIRNPVSLSELSVQVRLIWLLEMAVAVRLVGAAGKSGAASVEALAMLE
jgi:hypothetical protein